MRPKEILSFRNAHGHWIQDCFKRVLNFTLDLHTGLPGFNNSVCPLVKEVGIHFPG